jgi:hypothetical protein
MTKECPDSAELSLMTPHAAGRTGPYEGCADERDASEVL